MTSFQTFSSYCRVPCGISVFQSHLAACFETTCGAGAGGPSLLACQVSDYTHRHQARERSCLRGQIINDSNAESSGGMFWNYLWCRCWRAFTTCMSSVRLYTRISSQTKVLIFMPLSEKFTSFSVLYSGGHKCNSQWGVSLRSGIMQIWRKAMRRNRISLFLRLTRHALRKAGGDQSSDLLDPSLVLCHCATFKLTTNLIINKDINIFATFLKLRNLPHHKK